MDIDKSNMKQMILDFPGQFPVGYGAAGDAGKSFAGKEFKNIVIAGMGGSALPGELLKMFAQELNLKLPVIVSRDYSLHSYAGPDSLVIAISYSGNTEETVSAYMEAKKKDFSLAVIASGGKLKELAEEDKNPFALIPSGTPPRLAIGYQFAALLGLLANSGIIENQEQVLQELASSLKPEEAMGPARELAEKIKNKTPLIYTSENYRQLAYILKIQINENGKRHAFYNCFPELNHNEMVGYTTKNDFYALIFKSEDDDPRIVKRMELTAKLIQDKGYDADIIDISEKNRYNRVFNTALFGAWLSYFFAVQNEIDPTPVDIIEDFKKSL